MAGTPENWNTMQTNKRQSSIRNRNILHRSLGLEGNYTRARKFRANCKSCGKEHENWSHLWKCKKYRPIWRKLSKLMNDTTHGGEEGETHRYSSRKWIHLGIKRRKRNTQRASTATHDNMEFIIQTHTKAALVGIPPTKINTGNFWEQIMSRLFT